MAPYAASYVPPLDHAPSSAPVVLTLALGGQEVVEEGMDLEWLPPSQADVLAAVKHLRDDGGLDGMQLDLPWEVEGAGAAGAGAVVVVDTNILISHLSLLQHLVALVSSSLSSSSSPPALTLLIPHIVLLELDGLKSSSRIADSGRGGVRGQASISTLARAATNWLLSCLSPSRNGEGQVVKGQRKSETLLPPEGARGRGDNDSIVLDAALFFARRGGESGQGSRAVLLSDDQNLKLRATFEGVEAVGVLPGEDAKGMLERLGTPVSASPLSAAPRPFPPALPPSSSYRSLHYPPHSPPKALRSPPRPARQPSLPPISYARPVPLPSTLISSSFMDLDPPIPPPLTSHRRSPALIAPVSSPSDVLLNISFILAHFLAFPVFLHVFYHLQRERGAESMEREWYEELGDWSSWTAGETVERVKRWWKEGDVEGLCRKGLEVTVKARALPSPIPTPPIPASPLQLPRTQTSGSRAPSSSRWATPTHTPARATSLPSPPAPPRPPLPSPLSTPSLPSSTQQLSSLLSSLPSLITSLITSLSSSSPNSWSAPRWEVLLESVALLLRAVLGGATGADVGGEVRAVVKGWEGDLRGVGVGVRVEV
ncbi:hypothetical protein JCM8547_006159 [Rhodosporidiobolus lusitaniae]